MSGSGTTWEYVYTAPAGDGTETISFSEGTDAAGNVVTANPTGGATFTVDNTPPSITVLTISSDNSDTTKAKAGDTVTLAITSDETLVAPTVVFTSGDAATANGASVTATGSGTSWSANYIVDASDTNGVIGFTVTPTDLAGNQGIDYTQANTGIITGSVTVDTVKPTITGATMSDANGINKIIVTFSTPLLDNNNVNTGDYAVVITSPPKTGTSVASAETVDGALHLTLNHRSINGSSTVTLTYTQSGTTNQNITDAAGNPVETASVNVTNNLTTVGTGGDPYVYSLLSDTPVKLPNTILPG